VKPSGPPDKLVALADGVGQEGAVEHLGEGGHLGWRAASMTARLFLLT
jgi:hypothetical protein